MNTATTQEATEDKKPIRLVEHVGFLALYQGNRFFANVIQNETLTNHEALDFGWRRLSDFIPRVREDLWFEKPDEFPEAQEYIEQWNITGFPPQQLSLFGVSP